MLHHEKSPEKPPHNMAAPTSRHSYSPNLPYPPFLANILRLPFPSILKKLNPAPHLWRTGGSNYVLAFFLLSTQQIQEQIQKMQKLVQTFTTFNRTDVSFFEKAIKYGNAAFPSLLPNFITRTLKKFGLKKNCLRVAGFLQLCALYANILLKCL